MLITESGLKSIKTHISEKSIGHTHVVMQNLAGLGRKLMRQSKRETHGHVIKREIHGTSNKASRHFVLPNLSKGASEHLKNITVVKESDVTAHSDSYILSVIEAVAADGAEGVDVAKLFEASPKITSSGVGQFAIAAMSAVVESDTLAKNFLDMELVEGTPVLYFTKPTVGAKIKEEITKCLESFGTPEILVNFDDPISEGQKSELLVVGIPFVSEKAESVLADAAAKIEEAGCSSMEDGEDDADDKKKSKKHKKHAKKDDAEDKDEDA